MSFFIRETTYRGVGMKASKSELLCVPGALETRKRVSKRSLGDGGEGEGGIYFIFNFVEMELDFISDHSETSRLIPQPSPPTQFQSCRARQSAVI